MYPGFIPGFAECLAPTMGRAEPHTFSYELKYGLLSHESFMNWKKTASCSRRRKEAREILIRHCESRLLWRRPEFVTLLLNKGSQAACVQRRAGCRLRGPEARRLPGKKWELKGKGKCLRRGNGTLLSCRESRGRAWKLAKLLSDKAPFHQKVVVC